MSRPILLSCFFLTLAVAPAVASPPNLQAMYQGGHWFALRDALQTTKGPLLYQGAVKAAFNDIDSATKDLEAVVKASPTSDDAADALMWLTNLDFRNGRYKEALAHLDAEIAIVPDHKSLTANRSAIALLSEGPDLSVGAYADSKVRSEMLGGVPYVPVTINGMPAKGIVDTGGNVSIMTDAEAKRLSLTVRYTNAHVGDATGGSMQTGVATTDLKVGDVLLKNVSFMVVKGDGTPFAALPLDHQQNLGIPILTALRNLRWTSDGTLEIGFVSGAKDIQKSNVCFNRLQYLTQADFQGRTLDFQMDTGAPHTALWPPFAKEFPAVIKDSGTEGNDTVSGAFGAKAVDVVVLPEVKLKLGGIETVSHDVRVRMSQTGSTSRYNGILGIDLLNQAHQATLDFNTMTLTCDYAIPDFTSLVAKRHWFSLRDALNYPLPFRGGARVASAVSPLYRGLVAAAFNDTETAEKLLLGVIADEPESDNAVAARRALTMLYERHGRYADALLQINQLIPASESHEFDSYRATCRIFGDAPPQKVAATDEAHIVYATSPNGLLEVPAKINGKAGYSNLDSNQNVSLISESVAKELGISYKPTGVQGSTPDGHTYPIQAGVAKTLLIGATTLENVAFLVLPDSEPMDDMRAGSVSVLGFPVLLALKTIEWDGAATMHIGFPGAAKDITKSNLCLDETGAEVQALIGKRKLNFSFNTASTHTALFPPYAKELAAAGPKDVALAIGDLATPLPAGAILSNGETGPYDGVLGMDLLGGHGDTTIDFSSMTLTLK